MPQRQAPAPRGVRRVQQAIANALGPDNLLSRRVQRWSGLDSTDFPLELFGPVQVGLMPRAVHSRFGLHGVEALRRQRGVQQSIEGPRGAGAMTKRPWTT